MSAESKDVTIAALVRQIDENNERLGALESENARLRDALVETLAQRDAARAVRDDLATKVAHANRKGW